MIPLSILVLFFILLLLLMFITGIVLWVKKHRVAGSVVGGIPLVIAGGLYGLFFWLFHSSTPESLELSVKPTGATYTLHGKWGDRPDHYSFGTDFILFYTPNDQPIQVTNRVKGDWKPNWYYFDKGLAEVAAKDPHTPKDLKGQIFDIQLQDEFDVSFALPEGVALNQVTIQYVHVISEPMDAFEFWVKTYTIP